MEPLPAQRPHAKRVRAPIRPASVVAAATITAVVLVTGVSIALADDQSTKQLGGAAAKYLPVDGQVEWLRDNLGTVRMSESARSIGYADILLLPTSAGAAVVGWLGDDSGVAQLWRESTLAIRGADGDQAGVQTIDLHRLSAEGLSLIAGYGGSIGFAYSPALLELPADVAAGSTWSSAGDALPNGVLTYTAEYAASEPSDRQLIATAGLAGSELDACLQTDGTSVYRDGAGVTILDIVEADLWCVGRGRVAIVATVNGTPVVQGPAAEPSVVRTSTSALPPTWGSAGGWRAVETPTLHRDAFFGEQQLPISLANSPRRTDSGLILAVNQNGDDVVALRLDRGALVRQWIAHPGGEVTTLETAGDVTIVTTSQRRIVAYSEIGQRLWTMDSPELVLAPPTDGGNGTVVLVGLDGTVWSVDAITGDVVWQHKLNADVSLSAAVESARVVVVDRAGAITALDRATGETTWSVDSGQVPTDILDGEGVIVIVGEDGFLRAYDSKDGARLWDLRYTGTLRAAVALGGTGVFATDEATRGVDLVSGAVLWSRGGAQDAVTDGVRAVLFSETAAHLIDASGVARADWVVPSLALSIYRYAVAGGDGFWVFRSNQPALAVGRP